MRRIPQLSSPLRWWRQPRTPAARARVHPQSLIHYQMVQPPLGKCCQIGAWVRIGPGVLGDVAFNEGAGSPSPSQWRTTQTIVAKVRRLRMDLCCGVVALLLPLCGLQIDHDVTCCALALSANAPSGSRMDFTGLQAPPG